MPTIRTESSSRTLHAIPPPNASLTLSRRLQTVLDGYSAPQLPRRNDDLRQLCPDGMTLATVCSARMGLRRTICREHDSQGSQHVAVPRMETVQETLVLAVASGGLDSGFLKYSE